jgi:membrane associated rhomboid family serine protease
MKKIPKRCQAPFDAFLQLTFIAVFGIFVSMNILRKPFRYTYKNATLWLIVINVIFFGIQELVPRATAYLALNPLNIIYGHAWWQFVSYMFAHGGWSHIIFNMLALFIFGTPVERRIGTKEFVLYYMLTGILAGVFSFFVYLFTSPYTFLLGASGALFAVQLLYAALFPTYIIYIWGILPLRAPIMVLGFTALEIFSAFTGFNAGVGHLTHLAGFAFGWVYMLVRFRYNPWRMISGR